MKKITLLFSFLLCIGYTKAQISTVGNDKPLGFLNPALQNYEFEKGIISASYILNPFTKEESPASMLAIGEFKISEAFRIGINASQLENRLGKNASAGLYASYRLELEKENYLILGASVGGYSVETKASEFNQVFSPNYFVYGKDSASSGQSSGIEIGVGVAYSYNGVTFGLGFNKLNKPKVYPYPIEFLELKIVGSDTTVEYTDTTVILEEGNFGLESNINIMYEWDANDKLSFTHSLHLGNIDLAGVDYIGFQNIAEINNKHSVGLGLFYNGNMGYIASAGYGITENIKLGVTAFFTEDLNYNLTTKEYDSEGYKPSLEINLKFEF